MKAIFLGPVGTTFSHNAFEKLSVAYNLPEISSHFSANTNREMIPLIITHSGYGAIAMETLAEGRVAEPVESFIELLKSFDDEKCPINVLGAIRMELHFCLMAKIKVPKEKITKIIGHTKALGACKKKILSLDIPSTSSPNNGEAARLVSISSDEECLAALGPHSAAKTFNLEVIDASFEDKKAATTFFLIGPRDQMVHVGKENRCLIVFEIPHTPGSLVEILSIFSNAGIDLIQIHSVHVGNHTYHFAIEMTVSEEQLPLFADIEKTLKEKTTKHICFGPFEVIS